MSRTPTDPQLAAAPASPVAKDPDRLFRADHLRADLQGKSVKSGSLVLASQGAQFVMGMGSMMVLGRLLGPGPFGLLAMAATLTTFVYAFREFGFGMATIQSKDVTHRQVSHLFWLNLRYQILIAWGMFAAGFALAWFYREDDLVAVVGVLAVGMLANGAMNLHRAILRRQMRFGTLTMIDLVAQTLGIAVALTGAIVGAGYWSLVLQQATISFTEAVGFATASRWVPARHHERAPRSDEGVQRMLSYSKSYTWARVIEYASANADQILIGRLFGKEVLGLYAQAFKWSVLPVKQVYLPLQHVVVAGASRLQDQPEKYRAYMRKALLATFAVVLPTLALLCVMGRDFILILLGDKWSGAIPIFRVLVLGAFVGSAAHLTRWVYLSEGRSREQLRWTQVSTPLLVVAIAVGVWWGPMGVAWAIAASTMLLTFPNVRHCLKGSPLTMGDFWGAALRPGAISILAAAAVLLADDQFLHAQPLLARVPASIALFGAGYLAGWCVLPGAAADRRQLFDILSVLLARKTRRPQ